MFSLLPNFARKKIIIPEQKNISNSRDLAFFVDHNVRHGFKFAQGATTQELIRLYQTIAPLNDALDTISQAVAGLPIILEDKKSKELIQDHPALDILHTPNMEEQKTKEALFFQMAFWKLLEGDIYLNALGNINKPPTELFILKPQFITIEIDQKTGFPSLFRFNANQSQHIVFKKDVVNGRIFNVREPNLSELLHDKNFNPDSTAQNPTGMSEVRALLFEVNSYLESNNHNLSLLMNGARPTGVMSFNPKNPDIASTLSEQQYTRIKNQLAECDQGSGNAGKPMLLEGGLEWIPTGMSLRDMDFFNLQMEARKMIFTGLGIPEQMKFSTSATFNNKAEARLEFYENRVLPFASDILSTLTTFLLKNRFGEESLQYTVDLENVNALGLKRAARNKTINENTALTLNEKREKQGAEEIAGGDFVFTASGVAIAGDGLGDDDETPIEEEEDD
jgi:HK97 family phage portal protein